MKGTLNLSAIFFSFYSWGLVLYLWPGFIHAQLPGVSFEAYTDAKEVLADSYFEVSFTLKNANGVDFKPPNLKDFKIIAGPSTSTSMQIVNGVVTREMGYSYTLQPKREGIFTIGSATINANGKKLKTNPLPIKVMKGGGASVQRDFKEGEAYVIIQPSKTEVYPGEQLLLDFKLFTTVSLDGYDITEEPDYKGFYVQELRRFNSRTQQEVINGKQVTTKVLRRLALFPQQTGELTIPSARIQLAVIEDDSRTGFFFRRNVKPLFISTEPVTITIRELPSDSPEGFTGAVGEYEFQSSVNRMQATTDDAVSVTMMITGDGDLKRVQPPPLFLSDSFEIYPPKVLEEKLTENQGKLIGRKVIEYLILPKFPGEYAIQPVFSFFNTATKSFEDIKSGPYGLFIKQGSDRHILEPRPQQDEGMLSNDIRFIKMESSLERSGHYLVVAPVFWIVACLPLLAFAGLFMFKRAKRQATMLDIAKLKTKEANKVALQRLSRANGLMESGLSKEFYNEISKASLGYICDKMGIQLSELSKENVKERLLSMNVSSPLVEGFMVIMETCEMAIFAGMEHSSAMGNTYDQTIEIIGQIEEEMMTKLKR